MTRFFLNLDRLILFALLIAPGIMGALFDLEIAAGDGSFSIPTFLGMIIFFGWLYSIGSTFYSRSPGNLLPGFRLFQVSCLFPFLFIVVVLFMANWMRSYPAMFLLLMAWTFMSVFYCLYFAAKSISIMEHGQKSRFGDYIGDILLIGIYPIGVWFVQPKIQRLLRR